VQTCGDELVMSAETTTPPDTYPHAMHGLQDSDGLADVTPIVRVDDMRPDEDPNPARCLWCSDHLPAGPRRGSVRRFCRTEHRTAFHSAARRFVNEAITAGRLTVADLHAPGKACALATGVSRPGGLAQGLLRRPPLVRVLWAEPVAGSVLGAGR
jgi:hypothetical protein